MNQNSEQALFSCPLLKGSRQVGRAGGWGSEGQVLGLRGQLHGKPPIGDSQLKDRPRESWHRPPWPGSLVEKENVNLNHFFPKLLMCFQFVEPLQNYLSPASSLERV